MTTLDLTDTQKAAVVLLQLGQERAAKVLALLSEGEVEDVTAEIARMEDVAPDVAADVVRDFHRRAVGGEIAVGQGGMAFAQRLLEASLGPERAAYVMERLGLLMAGQPFDFLQHSETREVLSILAGEHPQTIALVLAHLRADRAAAILAGLPAAERVEVAHRIARMEQTSPEVVTVVAETLRRRGAAVIGTDDRMSVGGVQPLVEILTRSDPGTEKQILADLEEPLADELRSLMFTFEDVVLLEDRALQLVLRQVDVATLAVALKGASEAVQDTVRRNLSERVQQDLADETEVAGAVRLSLVAEARAAVVAVIRSLEESGQVVIRRNDEDDYVE